MVSKAREDLPEPLSPVITTSESRGISISIFFRLCSRAPRTEIFAPSILALPKAFAMLYQPFRSDPAEPPPRLIHRVRTRHFGCGRATIAEKEQKWKTGAADSCHPTPPGRSIVEINLLITNT